MWRKSLLIFAPKLLRSNTFQKFNKCGSALVYQGNVWNRCTSTNASYSGSKKPKTLRLWSDGGGDIASSPFDDLGAWHEADATSFLHNVSVDSVGVSTHAGKRHYNEDRFQLLELEADLYFFAVFDGHGGSEAADFVQNRLHHIVRRLHRSDQDLQRVLVEAFEECDLELKKHMKWLITDQGKTDHMAEHIDVKQKYENIIPITIAIRL